MADNLLEYRDLAKANSFSFNLDLILFSKTVMRLLSGFFFGGKSQLIAAFS
jgi:hypothetical protein